MNRLVQLAHWFALASALLLSTARVTHAEEISVTQWGSSLYGLPYAVAMEQANRRF